MSGHTKSNDRDDVSRPRVTLGIATFNRADYLEAAIRSALDQDYESLEVLVVLDGTTNPQTLELIERMQAEPRLRVIRHPTNLGIAAAYNSFVQYGRGELIAMIGDDDLCLPGRITRQVEVFDRHPDTGVTHGSATIIDASGTQIGLWSGVSATSTALVRLLFFRHNHIVDPTRMVHRRVYEQIGGYDSRYPIAADFDLWLRAAREFPFRNVVGEPLTAVRRHGENASDEQLGRGAEIADVEAILREALNRYELRELVPGLDWAVIDQREGERQALLKLADGLEARLLPMPHLPLELRERAAGIEPVSTPTRRRQPSNRLMMTSFGFDDTGGGATVPRLAAKELARRGWEVSVFHAATELAADQAPYTIREWDEDGVHLIGVYNRDHVLFDIEHPERELSDPRITTAFAHALDQLKPDAVHFHNLHNLGAELIDEATARGLPSFFTTHNYWLICPRGYLQYEDLQICAGPGDGRRCAACVGRHDQRAYRRRLAMIKAHAHSGLTRVLAVSDSVRATFLANGYDPDLVDVVRQAMPHDLEIWNQLGRDRRPGRSGDQLVVAFVGSAYPQKGPQLLIEAAQQTNSTIAVKIIGEVPTQITDQLDALDRRRVVEYLGKFEPDELPRLLANVDAAVLPSLWWDCSPLVAAECKAARLPLIVPRLGGLPETIRDEHDGLSFDGLDATDLARQLDRLASEPGLLERLQAGISSPALFSDYIDQLEDYYVGRRGGTELRPPNDTTLSVRWVGEHGVPNSLSIVNDAICSRLPLPVERISVDGARTSAPAPSAAAVEVRHRWPPDLSPPPAGALATIVPWEFGSVPRKWVEQIQANVDELWVPSEFVRRMYVEDGVDADRVVTIPNGVDLDLYRPLDNAEVEPKVPGPIRFLFVGGLIARKSPDLLLTAWREAFPGREDVVLTIKDFGADGVYRNGNRDLIRIHAAAGTLPRIELIEAELDRSEMISLYQQADVLVHPYRGEGFAMPVLEAMACGLPVIATAGGPTDEFCPPQAGWRIRSERRELPPESLHDFDTVQQPWMLEPDLDHLTELLRVAADQPDERRRRGEQAREAAQHLSWDRIADLYTERIRLLATRPNKLQPAITHFPFADTARRRILATPAWLGEDHLTELLANWSQHAARDSGDCLYLLADPARSGSPASIEQRVYSAASSCGADLDRCADINILMESFSATRDVSLISSVDAYVDLHPGCGGLARLARVHGCAVLTPTTGIVDFLESDGPSPANAPVPSPPATSASAVAPAPAPAAPTGGV